jgi:peptidoglycan/LPS O-acetylase OafA/YrhL
MKEIDGLTGLRGYAALWIMLFHSLTIITPFYGTAKKYPFTGIIGVDMFFVLSGFLLFIPFADALIAEIPIPDTSIMYYFKKRFLRIFPAYYAQIAILAGLSLAGVYEVQPPSVWIAHIFMVHNFYSGWAKAINGVWWTLAPEFDFYLVLPLLFLLIRKKGMDWFILSAIQLSIVYKLIIFPHITNMDDGYKQYMLGQLPGRIDLFAIGMTAAFIYRKYYDQLRNFPNAEKIMVLAGIIGIGGFYLVMTSLGRGVYYGGHWSLYIAETIYGLIAAILILGITLNGGIGKAIFSNRVMVYFGTVSYSIYLWHVPILRMIFENKSVVAALNGGLKAGIIVMYVGIVFAVSHLSYRWIEKPFIRLSHVKSSLSRPAMN